MKRIIFLGLVLTFVFLSVHSSKKIEAVQEKTITYTVQKGECLSVIADKFKGKRNLQNVIEEIKFDNNCVNESIMPGQKLKIKVEG